MTIHMNTKFRGASGMVWIGAFLLIFTLAMSVHSYAAGPIEINNPQDFNDFCSAAYSGYAGETVVLNTDLKLDNWSTELYLNNVIFDGNNHTITLNNATQSLFTIVGDSTANTFVKNLTLEGNITKDYDCGSFAEVNYGTIDNCCNKANIRITTNDIYRAIVGGVVSTNSGTITKCENQGSIEISCGQGEIQAGGIAGTQDIASTVEQCKNSGSISITESGSTTNEKCSIGGITGLSSGTVAPKIIQCLNMGKITVSTKGSSFIGGILGTVDVGTECEVSDCIYLSETANSGISNHTDSPETGPIQTISLTEDDFISGKVTYFLNGRSSNLATWKQELGTDDYPVLDSSKPDVLEVSYNDDKLYANEIQDDSSYIVNSVTDDHTFDVYLDTTKYGGEGAKYLEAVAVIENGTTYPVTNYKQADKLENFIIFPVKTTDGTFKAGTQSLVVAKKNAESTVNLGFIGSVHEIN